jgi:hypothetical protein
MNRIKLASLAVLTAVVAPVAAASADIITKWDFNAIGVQAAPFNSPSPSTGSGTATTLGMTNNYNTGNTASDDVVATAGTANKNFSENTWRIRGAQTPAGDNGWALAAPQYTQGIELDASTVGYSNVAFSFDWYATTQGIRDLQVQYNLNVANSSGWTNVGGTSPTGTYVATPNDYYLATSTMTAVTAITVDLSGIAGTAGDASLGIRLVSAYDSTGNLGSTYASASLTGGKTVAYNNSSGNWRFDNLTFTGTAVPEPTSAALVGVAGLVFAGRRNRR